MGQTVGYFRGVTKNDGSGVRINIYCHAVRAVAGKYPDPLSGRWWNQLRCYHTPVEEWWSIWSNCTGNKCNPSSLSLLPSSVFVSKYINKSSHSVVIEHHCLFFFLAVSFFFLAVSFFFLSFVWISSPPFFFLLPPLHSGVVRPLPSKSLASSPYPKCPSSCHMHPKSNFTDTHAAWTHAMSSAGSLSAVGREIQRIRATLASAYDATRKSFCGYDDNDDNQDQEEEMRRDGESGRTARRSRRVRHVVVHVRSGDATGYGGMGSVASSTATSKHPITSSSPPDRVYSLFHQLYDFYQQNKNKNLKNILRFHLHTETLALSPNYRGIYSELGPRLVFQADRPGWAMLDEVIPVHVILNAEATQVLECLRSAGELKHRMM